MGTHPSLPSQDLVTQRSLLDLANDNKALIGEAVAARFGGDGGRLPFLFKVLSINKALSIQAHPNKKLAEQLHAKDPKNYPGMFDCHRRANSVLSLPIRRIAFSMQQLLKGDWAHGSLYCR